MATLSSKATAVQLLMDLEAQPRKQRRFAEVWEYLHIPTGHIHWAMFTKAYFNDLDDNPLVGPHIILWTKGRGMVNEVGDLERMLGGKPRTH